MLLEMHCHTAEHSSCSAVPAVELVRQVHAKGLQGIVLTDHHFLWSPAELAVLRREAGVPDHFRILSGQELSSADLGDVLVYGAGESLPKGTSLAEVRTRFPAAALVWAHPYRGNREPDLARLETLGLDGVEIFNSNHTVRGNSRGLRDWHRLRFTATAGTDTHGANYAGLYPTMFDHPVASIDELAAEIRAGRCRPFLKEIPRSGAHALVTEVTIGTKGQDEQRERFIVRELESAPRWQSAERAFHILQALVERGFDTGLFRVPRPIDEDQAGMILIEQGVRGKSLFDKLTTSAPEDWHEYVELAARWLARLHGLRLALTPATEFTLREEQRLARYQKRFSAIDHPHARKATEIGERVLAEERALLAAGPELLVQGHGDYHPKNIFIGQDSQENRSTLFVAAIDFESSLLVPPAFDVGCFLAQFRNQFFSRPRILAAVPEELFLQAYTVEAGGVSADFPRQVELFRARANLSIAAYLIKVGLGESPDLWRVLVEAERALTQL